MMNSISYRYKICDPIHGFIRFDDVERKIIDSRPFQRLRYIHQMGVAYLVFPGATHSRFEHSLGVMELATRLFDNILGASQLSSITSFIPKDKSELDYYRRVLRLAALAHDLGHLPFSHTAERELLGKKGHEKKTLEILESKELLAILLEPAHPSHNPEEDVIKLASPDLFKGKLTPWEKILSQIIDDDYFGADRIDYLLRDAAMTGVGYGHLDSAQLIDTLRLLPIDKGGELTIGVAESGLQSVESLMMARYLMYSRIYHHPRCRLYTKHMARFMVNYFQKKGFPDSLEGFLEECDFSIYASLQKEAKEGDLDAKALLKQGESYSEIPLPIEVKGRLKELGELMEKRFSGDYFLDAISGEKRKGEIPLLTDQNEVVSAATLSFFLREHPTLASTGRLYVNFAKQKEVVDYLKKSKIFG